MKKLLRFVIVSLLFVLTFMLFYSLLPTIVWIFGGSFTDVSQAAPYVAFSVLIIIPVQGFIFSECFDSNFYPKR